jgi:hypothetical protein
MKKLVFGLLATLMFGNLSFGQTSIKEWKVMMEKHKESIESILTKECPKEVKLNKFKEQLLNGEAKLSENAFKEIETISEPVINYARMYTNQNNIIVDSNDELIFYAGFYPSFPINNYNYETSSITADELWYCALEATGVGFATSVGIHELKEKGIKFITKKLTKFLVKFAGPVGTAMTVADFGFCLYRANQN